MRRRTAPAIAPALFNFVRDYSVEAIEATKKDPAPEVSLGPLTVFVDNFFGQFFKNVLGVPITGFSDSSHERAVKIRLGLEKQGDQEAAIEIVSSYQTYCRIHPDVEQDRSVPDDVEAFEELRSILLESFMPQLLERIESWAREAGDAPIATAARDANEHLEAAKIELGL